MSVFRWVNFLEFLFSFVKPLTVFYLYFHWKRVKSESEAAKICVSDRVLLVGGGAIPHTAIQIALQSGATITTLDNRVPAIDRAKAIVKYYNVQARVIPSLGDALFYPIDEYDVLIIATHVKPKNDILNRILQSGKMGQRIIVRDPVIFSSTEHRVDLAYLSAVIPKLVVKHVYGPTPLSRFVSYTLSRLVEITNDASNAAQI